ncbi:MAG: hypothetical protein IK014_07285, partial [Lachnospiraceae bacterium]|nr:hypothetical protein [Lachnospiraceae bacterium]
SAAVALSRLSLARLALNTQTQIRSSPAVTAADTGDKTLYKSPKIVNNTKQHRLLSTINKTIEKIAVH